MSISFFPLCFIKHLCEEIFGRRHVQYTGRASNAQVYFILSWVLPFLKTDLSFRTGGWLPQDHRIHKQWLEHTIKHVDQNPKALHPLLAKFQDMIENDTRLYLLFNLMFDQIPHKKPYLKDPVGNRQVRDYEHMLQLMDHLMTTAPSWNDREHEVGLVGLPFQALFDWPMATSSGFAVFLDPQVNAILKKILNAWGEYLKSPESAKVLNTDSSGWFGQRGKEDLTTAANVATGTSLSFEEMFICDPSAKHHGFTSWDNFFTRTFRDGVRPVACPSRDEIICQLVRVLTI